MGNHREQIVDISTPAVDAGTRAAAVRDWLVSSGWAVSHDDNDGTDATSGTGAGKVAAQDWLYPSEPALLENPGILDRWPGLGGITFVVVPGTEAFVAGEDTEVPVCPRCGELTGTWEQLEEWDELAAEPVAECSNCGHRALVGDWNLEGSIALGSLAVVIDPDSGSPDSSYDPAVIARTLRAELTAGVGGRWAYVHLHS
jgi:DNA-directed RNA polymerase subunit RPC12/RpoP